MLIIKNKIISTIPAFVREYFEKGSRRSVSAKKNITYSFIYKVLTIAINFILVPLTIKYVNPTQYGIWLSLSSVMGWMIIFDIGLGNGLRNKFAEAVAKGHHKLAKIYVSTAYAILTIIISTVLIVFLCINGLLNWAKILNTSIDLQNDLSKSALIVFVFFSVQFILQLIVNIHTAYQKPAMVALTNLCGSILSLTGILILMRTTEGNIVYLSLVLTLMPLITMIVSTVWFYSNEYKIYAPSFKYIKFSSARNLMKVGIHFFVIQIGTLVLYQTDTIIVTQLFSPKDVTLFNVTYKLFSIISLIFGIILTPFWSAFTDAYAKKDFLWIKTTFYKIQKYWLFLLLATIMLLAISPLVFRFWLGDKVEVSFYLSATMCFYVLGYTWIMIPCYLLNGIGKVKLQFYLYILCAIINIPISISLGKLLGLQGIVLSNVIIFLVLGLFLTIQSRKIINNSAVGIWNN